jgi:hypothetical protein
MHCYSSWDNDWATREASRIKPGTKARWKFHRNPAADLVPRSEAASENRKDRHPRAQNGLGIYNMSENEPRYDGLSIFIFSITMNPTRQEDGLLEIFV